MHDILRESLRGRWCWSICLAMISLMLGGCGQVGPKYWPVSGKVTFQGKPISAASIRFSNPQGGVDMYVDLDADSNYVVIGEKKGLPEGTYKVAITPKLDYSNIKHAPNGWIIPSTLPSRDRADIPTRYQKPATSELTFTVKPESNTYDVDME